MSTHRVQKTPGQFSVDKAYRLRYGGGTIVQRDDNPLQLAKYLISIAASLMANNEPWCAIMGQRAINAVHGFWYSYETIYIFPLENEEHWLDHGYDRSITTPTSGRSINSVQNGLLLRLDIQELSELYSVSVNPDVCTQECSSEF